MKVLSDKVVEQSVYRIDWTLTDEDGSALVPELITWTLTDILGTVINDREDVSVTPASSFSIFLSGNDLAIMNDENRYEYRILTICAMYDNGVDAEPVSYRESVKFSVWNETAIPSAATAESEINQVPATLDLTITRGDSWQISMDADVDMTGYVVAASFVDWDTGGTLVSATVTTVSEALGQYTISMTGTQTASLPRSCKWKVVVTTGTTTRAWIGGTVAMMDPQDV